MILFILLTSLIYVLIPDQAFAWGPGAHMDYALHALAHIATLAPLAKRVLKKYPDHFLYGNIAADIIFGKKYAGKDYHCHNWDVARPLLKSAKSDKQKAFMLGYLSHLSVDIIAHNFFVPYKIIRSYRAMTLRHTYWEMRYDTHMNPEVWGVLERLSKQNFEEHDQLLENGLKKALFSWKTNKKIFNSVMTLSRMKKWRQASILLTKNSKFAFEANHVQVYKKLCYASILDFLRHPESAKCFQADPSGHLKLLYARETVKSFRRLTRKKLLKDTDIESIMPLIQKRLKASIYRPAFLPDISDLFLAKEQL